ncbi:MAG TPA: 3-oxoadipate enol-lactonase [Paenalcaligenes sp.]|nr:3-oxoadipate enol-lactonase [Paenalcaligenes sp.]
MSLDIQKLDTARGTFRVGLAGDSQAPALVLSNSLGTLLEMWSPQIEAFAEHYRVICYDTRGHGGSPITVGPYDFAGLGRDVLSIMDALDIPKAAFCGVSMGGHTALWLGRYAAERITAIAVCNSAAKIGTAEAWTERAQALRVGGSSAMKKLAETAPERWFTADFIEHQSEVVADMQETLAQLNAEGYAACCDALGQSDLRNEISLIAIPTLVLTGDADPVTTVADAENVHRQIENSELVVLAASHISNIEASQAFTKTVLDFLSNPK